MVCIEANQSKRTRFWRKTPSTPPTRPKSSFGKLKFLKSATISRKQRDCSNNLNLFPDSDLLNAKQHERILDHWMADCPERRRTEGMRGELKHGLKISNDATHPYLVFVGLTRINGCRRSVMNPDAEEVFAQFYFRRNLRLTKPSKARPILPLVSREEANTQGRPRTASRRNGGYVSPDGRKYRLLPFWQFDGQGLLHFPMENARVSSRRKLSRKRHFGFWERHSLRWAIQGRRPTWQRQEERRWLDSLRGPMERRKRKRTRNQALRGQSALRGDVEGWKDARHGC